jgi:hypothetical protein
MTPKRSILALIALIAISAIVQHRNWAQLRPPQNKSGVATSAPTLPAPVDEGKAEGVVAALEIKNGDVSEALFSLTHCLRSYS